MTPTLPRLAAVPFLLVISSAAAAQSPPAPPRRTTVQDESGVFRLDLATSLQHGPIDVEVGGLRARGLWVDIPAGRTPAGKVQSFRLRWFWLARRDVIKRLGAKAGSGLSLVKTDLENLLVKAKGSKSARLSWAAGIGLPAAHDASRFRSPGPGTWRSERLGATTWQQFRGAQRADRDHPDTRSLLGYVGVHEDGERIFVNALWWDDAVLRQRPDALARYGRLAEETARSFRLIRKAD